MGRGKRRRGGVEGDRGQSRRRKLNSRTPFALLLNVTATILNALYDIGGQGIDAALREELE